MPSLDEIREMVMKSNLEEDWHTIGCWGGGSGPSFLDAFEQVDYYVGGEKTTSIEVDAHGMLGVYRPAVELRVAYGLDIDDGAELLLRRVPPAPEEPGHRPSSGHRPQVRGVIVDLFAGLGGWDHAARQLGLDPLGIEWNADACATREAVGLSTLHADISTLDPADFAPCEGLIASPPCQDFSVAGKGAGRDGERGQLVDEVMRWAEALRPRWVACEQVPPVLPIWREFAHRMEAWGYRCWTGLLSSERYGVPQTRERAILMASVDFTPQPPAPTHQEYRHGEPARREVGLFGDLEPWVSMAEALGYGMTERPAMTQLADDRGCGASSAREAQERERERERERGAWVERRPATTIAGDPRCFQPGGHHEPGQQSENAIRLTLPEGLILQGFPPDYPVQGTKTAQWLQVGNAIPPPLAKVILAQLVQADEAAA